METAEAIGRVEVVPEETPLPESSEGEGENEESDGSFVDARD